MQGLDLIFSIAVLIMSVVAHEVSHGYVAALLGDPTARLSGRLTLNPIKHIDPVGSILVPALTYFGAGFIFGWAKPVPYNPYQLRGGKWGPALVALAGPATNLLIAVIFGLFLRFGLIGIGSPASSIIVQIVMVNLVLSVFNFVPIPPLDGSKILFALLPYNYIAIERWMNAYQLLLVFSFILFGWQFIFPIIPALFRLIVGV